MTVQTLGTLMVIFGAALIALQQKSGWRPLLAMMSGLVLIIFGCWYGWGMPR